MRYYLESSVRSYYIDKKNNDKKYEEKNSILKSLPKKRFSDLLYNIPGEKKNEITDFYHELRDYVHFSERIQTDALKDFTLNIILGHPEYERDKMLLEKTFDYVNFLLFKSSEELS